MHRAAARTNLNADRATAVKNHSIDQRIRHNLQIFTPSRWEQVGDRSGHSNVVIRDVPWSRSGTRLVWMIVVKDPRKPSSSQASRNAFCAGHSSDRAYRRTGVGPPTP